MRAARALEMLLLLQRKGRMPAHQLAQTLEVSERTILRDVAVLSEAGVPIYTTRGVHGGIELLDGFQTNLTGMTTDEAEAVFLAGQPQVAHRLGLGAPTRTVRTKLLNALAPALAEEAAAIEDWFVHDPDPWSGNQIPHGELRRIARAIRRRRKVEITIDTDPTKTVIPLGLALKAGSWHLIHLNRTAFEVINIDNLRATRITKSAFEVPSEFQLADFWQQHVSSTRE